MFKSTICNSIRKHLKEDAYTQVHPRDKHLRQYEDFNFSFWAKILDEETILILVQDEKGNPEEYVTDYASFYKTYKF